MDNESDKARQREVLLQAVAALVATRDELLTCAELLREYQFETDSVGRRAATDFADDLIERARSAPTAKRRE